MVIAISERINANGTILMKCDFSTIMDPRVIFSPVLRLHFSQVSKVFPRHVRLFHVSSTNRIINPLLPFDVLDEVENEDIKDKNEELEKQKKKLIKQKRVMQKKLKEEHLDKTPEDEVDKDGSDGSDSSPKKRITEVKQIDFSQRMVNTKTDLNKKNKDLRDTGGVFGDGGAVDGGGGGGGPPSNNNNGPNDDPADANKNDPESSKEDTEKSKETKEDPESDPLEEEEEAAEEKSSKLKETLEKLGKFIFKCLETIGITLSSVGVLGLSGLLYHKFYNVHVLDKMDSAFQKGDPAYQLAIHNKTNKRSDDGSERSDEDLAKYWVERPQQQLLDEIVSGKIRGRYFLVVGEKGTGKTTLIMEAMKKTDGSNVAIFDAHADPEIFRIRLGKALNFAYNEDYIGSLFSIRGPRDTTALLDIERAFNKLEELAINRRILGKSEKPLIVIINNSHLIKENDEGIKLLELLQQKAESLSGSDLVTMIFNSDDYWVYEKLKRLGTRLELINVRDFNRQETVSVLQFIRGKYYPAAKNPDLVLREDLCHKIYDLIGGRPQHISQVARHQDVIKACHEIIDREKTWFLNQCGLLGEDMDDDVMESGKFASSAMLLMREFVEMDRQRMNTLISQSSPDAKDTRKDHHLPELPLWRSRQIMTRADYIQQYDNLNIFTVDSDSRVRADSVPMMRAFHEIASQPNFDALLNETIERVSEIESLGRTREVVLKDLVEGSTYDITTKQGKSVIEMTKKKDNDDEDINILMEEISKADHKKKWWKKRMGRFDESYLPPNDGLE
ncbi:hypothetical protein JCM33374_g3983 [Metschnikowia sp. JCM 33374]|nr:hypothetical protein JCM33374_g3983 [Metschnikowia sp. JCM 33374]